MTDDLLPSTDQGAAIAASIADHLRTAAPHAEVRINPHVSIPPHIAGNILEFMRRVKSEGMEAIAWVEAYQFVQQHAQQQQPGIPFGGLPQKK